MILWRYDEGRLFVEETGRFRTHAEWMEGIGLDPRSLRVWGRIDVANSRVHLYRNARLAGRRAQGAALRRVYSRFPDCELGRVGTKYRMEEEAGLRCIGPTGPGDGVGVESGQVSGSGDLTGGRVSPGMESSQVLI